MRMSNLFLSNAFRPSSLFVFVYSSLIFCSLPRLGNSEGQEGRIHGTSSVVATCCKNFLKINYYTCLSMPPYYWSCSWSRRTPALLVWAEEQLIGWQGNTFKPQKEGLIVSIRAVSQIEWAVLNGVPVILYEPRTVTDWSLLLISLLLLPMR